MAEIRRKPVLRRHLATIEANLADDKEAPPKQRHTARRIFDRPRSILENRSITFRGRMLTFDDARLWLGRGP
jgi:hypothetical protein